MALTSAQEQVLLYLVDHRDGTKGHASRDVSIGLGHRAAYWADEKLRSLQTKGFVVRSISTDGRLEYAPTDEGREWIASRRGLPTTNTSHG